MPSLLHAHALGSRLQEASHSQHRRIAATSNGTVVRRAPPHASGRKEAGTCREDSTKQVLPSFHGIEKAVVETRKGCRQVQKVTVRRPVVARFQEEAAWQAVLLCRSTRSVRPAA